MHLFLAKHQKLILQCYPAGRGSDKKPNSSELSYFLYYASTRRVKLEKVGRFLVKKNQRDVSRSKTGNIQVTLEILNALIKKCPDDLNVFADCVNDVLLSVLPILDLALCQHAMTVFNTFCLTLENDFTSDQEFTNNFNKLSEKLINFGIHPPKSNTNEWIAISLQASQSIAKGKNLIQTQGSTVINRIIPLILSHLDFDQMEERSLRRLNSHTTESLHEASGKLSSALNEDGNSTPVEVDLHDLALGSLKSYYYTDNSSQISLVTRTLADYCAKINLLVKDINILINTITFWVPVQLRFLILTILMGKLDKDGPEQEQLSYLVSITSLLSSPVNLIGLSVVDNLRQLLTLQSYLILKSTNSENSKLIKGYSNAIVSLTTHIYYQDQVLDIVNELIVTVKEILNANNSNYSDPNKLNLVSILLDNTKNVIVTSNSETSFQTSRIPLEVFSEIFGLLSYNDPARAADASQVQFKFIDLLITELNFEYAKLTDFRSANHDNLISDSDSSVVNLLFENIERVCKLPQECLNTNLKPLLELLQVFIQTFGINSAVNFIPFFLHWQLQDANNKTQSAVLLDNFGYFIAYNNALTLQASELAEQILSRIEYRRAHNLWLFPANYPSEQAASVSSSFNFSKEDLKQATRLIPAINDYHDTVFHTHYKYPSNSLNAGTSTNTSNYEPEITEDFDESYHEENQINGNGVGDDHTHYDTSQHISLAMLIQKSENHSIQSIPISARGLLNNNLNIPKVRELRRVISGFSLKQNKVNGGLGSESGVSRQRTDVTVLLNELDMSEDLGGRGNLTFH